MATHDDVEAVPQGPLFHRLVNIERGDESLTGPLVDQADLLPDLANPSFQDHANEAIHRFIH